MYGIEFLVTRDGHLYYSVKSRKDLFVVVERMTDTETAIEVDGWAELAAVGEVFEIRDIVVEVAECQ